MEPSDPDEAFDSIVARLGPPRPQRVVIGVTAAVGIASALVLGLGLHWEWSAVVVFAVMFVVALIAGLAVMNRAIHRRGNEQSGVHHPD